MYPVETIDQGIELLTGIAAGEHDGDGGYPEDSINGKVQARLTKFAEESDGSKTDDEDNPEASEGSESKK